MPDQPSSGEMDKSAPAIRVLIVDDHQMVRVGLRSMLTAPDIAIIGEATNGQEAIAAIVTAQPDVVLMDIRMPDMDGIAALELVKAQRPETRIIMVTSYRNTTYLLRALATGAAGFVLKDIPRIDLLATVRAVASGASHVDRTFLQSVLRDLNQEEQSATVATELTDPLSPRELDVLTLLVEGMTNQMIAHILALSPNTVKGYLQTIFQKLDVDDRTQAAVKAIRLGLVK